MTHQIGLSGRTVRPRLIITCGVSGAIQFTSCMKDAECIESPSTATRKRRYSRLRITVSWTICIRSYRV